MWEYYFKEVRGVQFTVVKIIKLANDPPNVSYPFSHRRVIFRNATLVEVGGGACHFSPRREGSPRYRLWCTPYVMSVVHPMLYVDIIYKFFDMLISKNFDN